ncbi:hypothetical protein [Mycobacterium lepromatosis]|uniref:hypothetical protein n=1 Tax=Mycobacterium lepromatosis TaxID=480418 RepID=UPI00067891B9|nr:hypothetical protein [Mycobacterium lepromatosis]
MVNISHNSLIKALTVLPNRATATPGRQNRRCGVVGFRATSHAGSLLSSVSVVGVLGSTLGARTTSVLTRIGDRNRNCLTLPAGFKESISPDKLKRLVAQISEKPETMQHYYR